MTSSSSTSDIPRPGEVIAGRYRVEQLLGAGGMGVVVAARHTVLGQRVAIKLLLPAAARLADASARFLREARAVVAMRSEHVARVLDMGSLENGAPYLVMEHLTGRDFARILKERGRLPISEAVEYLLQAGEAIAEAHKLGIVHRDLKPANLFLTTGPDGAPLVKVLDFGLSKIIEDEVTLEGSLTATGIIAGSPNYMSPEQVRSLKHVDARTDLWALGVILYEFLAGERPFKGQTLTAICASIVADPPRPLQSCVPDLPEPLEHIVLACLEKDSARRVQTVADLAIRLLPFATPAARHSAQRICRLSETPASLELFTTTEDAVPTAPLPAPPSEPPAPRTATMSAPPPLALEQPGPTSPPASAWGRTARRDPSRRPGRWALFVPLGVSFAAGLAWLALGRSRSDHELPMLSSPSAPSHAVDAIPPTSLAEPIDAASATTASSVPPSTTIEPRVMTIPSGSLRTAPKVPKTSASPPPAQSNIEPPAPPVPLNPLDDFR